MLSAIFLINSKGEIIIFRLYRDDVSMTAANTFRLSVIAAKEAGSAAPVRLIDGNTFLYIRHKDMFFVGVTRANTNAGACSCSCAACRGGWLSPKGGGGRGQLFFAAPLSDPDPSPPSHPSQPPAHGPPPLPPLRSHVRPLSLHHGGHLQGLL